jgi:hypothetical protein
MLVGGGTDPDRFVVCAGPSPSSIDGRRGDGDTSTGPECATTSEDSANAKCGWSTSTADAVRDHAGRACMETATA